jgi:hypothetical protein
MSSQILISHSAPTPNTSEPFVQDIEYYNRVLDEYHEYLIKLQLTKKRLEIKIKSEQATLEITKNNYLRTLFPQIWRQALIERDVENIKLLDRENTKLITQLEKDEKQIKKRRKEIKTAINGLTLYDEEIFRTMKRDIENKSKTLRTGFTSVGIKKIIRKKRESIGYTKTHLDDLFTGYKKKAIELMDKKIEYCEQQIYLILGNPDNDLHHLKNSIEEKRKEMKAIESSIEKALIKEHKLMEDYMSITMGGSIKNKYKVKKNSRKTMKRSSRI